MVFLHGCRCAASSHETSRPTERIGARSGVLDAVEPQSTRALAGAHTLAPREPEERGAVHPARVLEPAGELQPAARHLLLEQAQVATLRLEDPAERPREPRRAVFVDQRLRALQPDVRLLRV